MLSSLFYVLFIPNNSIIFSNCGGCVYNFDVVFIHKSNFESFFTECFFFFFAPSVQGRQDAIFRSNIKAALRLPLRKIYVYVLYKCAAMDIRHVQ